MDEGSIGPGKRAAPHRAALSALHHESHLKRDRDIDWIAAAGRFGKTLRGVLPRCVFAVVSRQVTLQQLAHIGERLERRHSRDDERLRQLTRPIGAGQGQHSSLLNNSRVDFAVMHNAAVADRVLSWALGYP